MKTVLSYCSARMFLKGLLPMVAMSPRQSDGAVNDNNLQRHVGLTGELCISSFQSKRAAYGLTGPVVAAITLVAGVLALPLLQGLVVSATTASAERSEVLRGSPIASSFLEPQENG
jgi:hypothetical protein